MPVTSSSTNSKRNEIPERGWSIVSQDLFHYRQTDYLITVDHYSDFWELDKLTDTRAETIVEHTKQQFSRHGIPQKVITDNGPQFIAADYEEFSRDWEFEHQTSSPYHSQSNGKAESAVKIVKNIIKKVTKAKQDLHLAILDWRKTHPLQMVAVQIRNRCLNKHVSYCRQQKIITGVPEPIRHLKQRAKQQYDKTAKPLP